MISNSTLDVRQAEPATLGLISTAPATPAPLGTVVHFCLQPDGGVWSHIRLLASRQRPHWRVKIVAVSRGTPRPGVLEEAAECSDRSLILSRPAIKGVYYMAPVNVPRILQKLHVDPRSERTVFHFHTGPTTPWFFYLPAKVPGKRLVTFHGSRGNFLDTGVSGFPRRLMGIGGAWKLKRHDYQLITISRQSARDCSAMYYLPESRFHVAYSGVIAADAPRPPREPGDNAPFHIGFLGTVKAAKGWQRVIAAARLLRERGKNVQCTIAGDGDEFRKLSEIASQNSAWLKAPGRIADPAFSFFPSLDVLVVPSDFEGLPLVLPEAMSCGVPCITSDVGGCREAVRDGREGFVLRQNSPEEIAEGITRLIEEPALWCEFARNGRRRYEELFTAESMCSALKDVYVDDSRTVIA